MKKILLVIAAFLFCSAIFAENEPEKKIPQIDLCASDGQSVTVTGVVSAQGFLWALKLDRPVIVTRKSTNGPALKTSRLLALGATFDFSRAWTGKRITAYGTLFFYGKNLDDDVIILISGLKKVKGYPPSILSGATYEPEQQVSLTGTIHFYPFHDAPKSDHDRAAKIGDRSGGSLNWRLHNGMYLLYNGQKKAKSVFRLVTKEGVQYFAVFGSDEDGTEEGKITMKDPKFANLTVEQFLRFWTGEMSTPYVIVLDAPINMKAEINPAYGISMVQLLAVKFSAPDYWDGKRVTVKGRVCLPVNNHHHTKIMLQVMDETDVTAAE